MPTPRDDRDQPCSIVRLTNRQLARRSIGMPALSGDEIAKQEQRVTINLEVVAVMIGAAIGWLLWTVPILPATSLKGSLLGNLLIPMMFSIVVSAIVWFASLKLVRLLKFPSVAGVHLRYGRCPGCGYALRGIPAATDGCVVCPECSAAWGSDRIGAGDV